MDKEYEDSSYYDYNEMIRDPANRFSQGNNLNNEQNRVSELSGIPLS